VLWRAFWPERGNAQFHLLAAGAFAHGYCGRPVIPVKQAMVIAESSPNRRGLNMGIVQNQPSFWALWLAPCCWWRWRSILAGERPFYRGRSRANRRGAGVEISARAGETCPSASSSGADPAWRRLIKSHNVLVSMMISLLSVAWFFIMLTFLRLSDARTALQPKRNERADEPDRLGWRHLGGDRAAPLRS
jgi:hypothetical protein